MVFTMAYIAVGLALTTIAIEISADALKRLHYFGRKIENVAAVNIWFGGKKLTMKALVKNLGDQFNLPTMVVKDLNLDTFVENAIKVEAGEMETLRPPAFDPHPDELGVAFVEDGKSEKKRNSGPRDAEPAWIADPTPSPSPEPSPVWVPTPKVPTPVLSPKPPREPTPKPRTPTPEPTPAPTPEPVREPTPPPPPRPPTPPPPPREPTPESEPEPEPAYEEERLIPEPPKREFDELLILLSNSLPNYSYLRKLTAAELEEQKRGAYSDEAWRRYQEYQKQWKKFRTTNDPDGAAGMRLSPGGGGSVR
ncbi:hypothetical protein PENTCL1PPCAC_3349, partial [Pristionchus entomophagus]